MTKATPLRSTLIVTMLGALLSGCQDDRVAGAPGTLPTPVAQATAQSSAATPHSYADVVSKVMPAVVTIRSESHVRAPRQFPFFEDERLRDWLGEDPRQLPGPQLRQGMGSGVIVSSDGYILTNHHVVDGAEQISVEMTGNRSFAAKLVGSDPPSDLAVLKIEASDLPVLALGDSDQARVGDVVLAVGNPLGVGQTVTMGILSAKGRSTGMGDGSFEDFLQMDAPINQGNSGGALVNANGELIGINSQILSPSGGNIGIGFAIPSNMARNVSEQLIETGKVRRGLLGVTIQPVTADIASSLGLAQPGGALVNSVTPNGPAQRAGLQRRDAILAVNGKRVADVNALRNQIAATAPGTQITLTVWRQGREQEVGVKLAELAGEQKERPAQPGSHPDKSESGVLGLQVAPLVPDLAEQLGLPPGATGLAVLAVQPGGPAEDAGIQRGDVILEVNLDKIRSAADLRRALQNSGDKPLLLLVSRRGQSLYLPLRPER